MDEPQPYRVSYVQSKLKTTTFQEGEILVQRGRTVEEFKNVDRETQGGSLQPRGCT